MSNCCSPGNKQKWVPMNIDHKSGRNRRSRSAGRAPRSGGPAPDKAGDRQRPERNRFGKWCTFHWLSCLILYNGWFSVLIQWIRAIMIRWQSDLLNKKERILLVCENLITITKNKKWQEGEESWFMRNSPFFRSLGLPGFLVKSILSEYFERKTWKWCFISTYFLSGFWDWYLKFLVLSEKAIFYCCYLKSFPFSNIQSCIVNLLKLLENVLLHLQYWLLLKSAFCI